MPLVAFERALRNEVDGRSEKFANYLHDVATCCFRLVR